MLEDSGEAGDKGKQSGDGSGVLEEMVVELFKINMLQKQNNMCVAIFT